MKKIILIFLFIFFLSFVSSQGILGVSPANYNYNGVLRGGYSERSFIISYSGENEVDVSVEPLGVIREWMNFSINRSKVSKEAPFRMIASVEPPVDMPNGNYSGILRIRTHQIAAGSSPGRATGNVLAVLDVVINVEVTDLEILSCTANNFVASSAEKGDDLLFRADFTNKGNVRVRPRFVIDLWDQDQVSIIKSKEFTAQEILPTRQGQLRFSISTNDLQIGQYWVDMRSLDCLDSQLLTVDVLQPGALKAQGLFREIIALPSVPLKETTKIIAIFENTGEKEVDAQFKGQITLDGKIVQILESEKTNVGIGEKSNFSFFFTPQKVGNYIIDGRFFYENKRTFASSKAIKVFSEGIGFKQVMLFLVYLIIIFAVGYLYYRIRKEIKKHGGYK